MTLLAVHDAQKAYAGVPALAGANLAIAAGEIHALMGENGAGKSTLIKILAGVVAPDRAVIEIDGQSVVIPNASAATALGLRFLHQELSIVPTLSVAENIFLGRPYPLRAKIAVDWRQLGSRARAALGRLGIGHIDPGAKMGGLPYADQMLVRIAIAFLEDAGQSARLYVMDEPTAALSRDELERLFAVLREIRSAGGSVLYVSHRLDEVMRISDRITVLRDGRDVATAPTSEMEAGEVVRLMIGRRVEEAYPRPLAAATTVPALEVEDLAATSLRPVSFSVRRGEILGLAGLAGAGQAEILRTLGGAVRARGGRIRIGGRAHRARGPAAAWRAGIAHVPRERRAEGLVLTRSIVENVTLPHLGGLSRGGAILARRRERELAAARALDVQLRSAGLSQLCLELSGGNQQKVAFAKALAGRPDVLLLDEPTRGVDVGAKFDIYRVIREMTARGMAVVLTSSDLPELLGMCDRILVVREGAVTAELDAAELSEEMLLNHCYGRAGAPAARAESRA